MSKEKKNVETVEVKENELVKALDAMCNEETGTERPTLRAIAEVLGVPQQRIYSVAKQPTPGVVYDAKVYNWDAINRFVLRRLDPENGLATVEDVVTAALLRDKELKTADRRRSTRAGTRETFEVAPGVMIPARRCDLAVGQEIMILKDETKSLYEVVFMTNTHACVQRKGTSVLTSYSNWTINQRFITSPEKIAELQAEKQAELGEEAATAVAAPAQEAEAEETVYA